MIMTVNEASLNRRGGIFSVALSVEWNLIPPSRTLSGTLLCGVRTFLPAHSRKSLYDQDTLARMGGATVRPSCQRIHYKRVAESLTAEFAESAEIHRKK